MQAQPLETKTSLLAPAVSLSLAGASSRNNCATIVAQPSPPPVHGHTCNKNIYHGAVSALLALTVASAKCRSKRACVSGRRQTQGLDVGTCRGCESGTYRSALALQATSQGAGSAPTSDDAEPEFPWSFKGRVRFRPALVSTPKSPVANGVQPLSLFGFTLGGSVCLEYDDSPVGPYFEVVQMAAAVLSERLGTLGQWGIRLMVSTEAADSANGDVWGVPSQYRDIDFEQDGSPGVFVEPSGKLRIGGWGDMRFAPDGARSWGNLPVWWTPTLKALWLPASLWRDEGKGGTLPLRRLRLSAAALRLRWAPLESGDDSFVGPGLEVEGAENRVPLPLVVEADGVLIEIGGVFDQL